MDPISQQLMMGAAGSGDAKTYIEDVFSTWLYTGNGSTQTITNGIDLSGKGGLVWVKGRSGATGHRLVDTIRGGQNSLQTNSTGAQVYEGNGISDFSSSGFFLGSFLGSDTNYNANGSTYASWTFRKAAKFFDVVTYTGNSTGYTTNGTNNKVVNHSLGLTPGCIIVKNITQGGTNWFVYHRTFTINSGWIYLNATSAQQTGAEYFKAADSATFTMGSEPAINNNGDTYVAYLFAHDTGTDGLIQCGTSTSGTFNNLGWEPQWVLVKPTTNDNWYTYDNMRGLPASGTTPYLSPNLSGAEVNGTNNVTVTATGFTQNLGNCVWIAIRRGPMKTPTDATKVLSLATAASYAANQIVPSSFPPDFSLNKSKGEAITAYAAARLTGGYLQTSSSASEAAGVWKFDGPGGQVYATSVYGTPIYWNFRRAPGFFDVVAYTGTASLTTRNHNLGSTPEMMIIKGRNTANRKWYVYHKDLGNNGTYDYELILNATDAQVAGGQWLTANKPTSTTFTNNSFAGTNGTNETYIAYLFATCPGVSKVGSYTGSGTTKQIDCGFTAGARFVLIKRTDSTGDWYVWDTARGIVSGNDPYLLLNSTDAEVTSTDYIDPLNSGFEISSTAPAPINANGGSFIYLAIA